MKIVVKKTDRRHTAGHRFGYYVDIKADTYNERLVIMEKFYQLRAWCWETWGATREATRNRSRENSWDGDNNLHWSWINDQFRARIYLATKDEAAYFTLRWS